MDGKWGDGTGANGETEWVVQNLPVTVTAGVVTTVTSPAFAFTDGILVPTHAWIRVALTKEQVPQNWDGSGQFTKGEIEDHVISMPIINGKEVPMLSVKCGGPYKFNGADSIKVTCDVTNYRGVAGTFKHEVIHEPGGGTVNVTGCKPAGVNLIAAAPDKVTITCDAAKGQTRDVWTFKATAIDPVFMKLPGGFSPEHSDTSSYPAVFVADDPDTTMPVDITITNLETGAVTYAAGVGSTIPVTGQFNGPPSCFPTGAEALINISNTSTGGTFDNTNNFPLDVNGIFNGETIVEDDLFGDFIIRLSATNLLPGCVLIGGADSSILESLDPDSLLDSLDPDSLDSFFESLEIDNATFSGQLGGESGCFPSAQIKAEINCIAIECGSFSASTTFSPNPDGSFKVPLDDFPDLPPGEFEFKPIDITSPDSANCPGGGVYAPGLDTYTSVSLIKNYSMYLNVLTSEPVVHGSGSSTKKIITEILINGPEECFPPWITSTTTSEDNANNIFEVLQNFEYIGLVGLEGAYKFAFKLSTEILFTIFGNYITLVEIPDVPISADCKFGAKHDPSLDQVTNPLPFGIF